MQFQYSQRKNNFSKGKIIFVNKKKRCKQGLQKLTGLIDFNPYYSLPNDLSSFKKSFNTMYVLLHCQTFKIHSKSLNILLLRQNQAQEQMNLRLSGFYSIRSFLFRRIFEPCRFQHLNLGFKAKRLGAHTERALLVWCVQRIPGYFLSEWNKRKFCCLFGSFPGILCQDHSSSTSHYERNPTPHCRR